jgi:NADH:ubiquinone oxidoreductase subunit 6 (subunit J)
MPKKLFSQDVKSQNSSEESRALFKVLFVIGIIFAAAPFVLNWLMVQTEVRNWVIKNVDESAGSGPYMFWRFLLMFVVGLVLILVSLIKLKRKSNVNTQS